MSALIAAAQGTDYPAEISLVISNRPTAPALALAEKAGINTLVIDHTGFEDRASFDAALHTALSEHRIDLVCLAGFMRLFGADFVSRWRDRLINIHPSLLPAFKGLHTHQRALEAGVRFTGATVHFVRAEMDDGPIIAQAVVPIAPNDDEESLTAKVLKEEHRLYADALKLVASGRSKVRDRHVVITDSVCPQTIVLNPTSVA